MSSEALEKKLFGVDGCDIGDEYGTIDIYAKGTTALYTPPPKPFGLMDPQPFQMGYDLPETGSQLHLHGPDKTRITYGTIEDYNGNVLRELNGYESSMAALNADILKLRKIIP